MSNLLFAFSDVILARPGSGPTLQNLSWQFHDGETWAVVGPNGSGKTTLALALVGRLPIRAGSLDWPLLDRLRNAGRHVAVASDVARFVSFKEESASFSYRNHYYQERFNLTDPHEDITVGEFLRSGTRATDADLQEAAGNLGVRELLDRSLLALSNGQLRRTRIAKALASRPELLVLDDPFLGLDASGRETVSEMLGKRVRAGTRVVIVADPAAVPDWVTHVLELRDGGIAWQGPRTGWRVEPPREQAFPVPHVPLPEPAPILELRQVSVAYGTTRVLDGVDWTVRVGERWALLGPNGCGKSTLLSLVVGDHPQVFANDVSLYGRRRGTGETIWDVKQNVGLVSPEFHLYFGEPLTAEQTIATGFFDAVAYHRPSPEQTARVRELLADFAISRLASRPFSQLSTGEQRLVLLLRALVKQPALLILDEPFQALDAATIRTARNWLDTRLRPEQSLVFVTHYPDEIPRSVDRVLRLRSGKATVEPSAR